MGENRIQLMSFYEKRLIYFQSFPNYHLNKKIENLNVNDLAGDPGVEGFGVFGGLDDDSGDGSFGVVGHQPARVHAQAVVDVLKARGRLKNRPNLISSYSPSCRTSCRSAPPGCSEPC
jgi:hypothetical protein